MGIPRSWGEGPGISDFFPRRAGIFFIFFFPGARLRFFFEFSKILGKGNTITYSTRTQGKPPQSGRKMRKHLCAVPAKPSLPHHSHQSHQRARALGVAICPRTSVPSEAGCEPMHACRRGQITQMGQMAETISINGRAGRHVGAVAKYNTGNTRAAQPALQVEYCTHALRGQGLTPMAPVV